MRPTPFFAALLLVACNRSQPPAAAGSLHRVVLTRTDEHQFALVPEANQPPFCLVYSVSATGLIRQLTMPENDESYECPALQPIGGSTFRVPRSDGKTRLFVLMSSQALKASSVTRQLLEVKDKQALSVLDFRLPGAATLDVLEFDPT